MILVKKSGRWKRALIITAIILLLLYYFLFAFPFRGMFFNHQRHGNPPLTPAWATLIANS